MPELGREALHAIADQVWASCLGHGQKTRLEPRKTNSEVRKEGGVGPNVSGNLILQANTMGGPWADLDNVDSASQIRLTH